MQKKLKKLFKESRSHVKSLHQKISKLKKEQRRNQKKEDEASLKIKEPHTKEPQHVVVEFSMSSVAKATLVVIGLYLLALFLGEISNLLVIFFVSLFLAAALDSIVDKLEVKKIPRALSIIGIYVIFFLIAVLFFSTLIPLVATQTLELARTVSDLITNLTHNEKIWTLPYTEGLQDIVNDFLESIDQDTIIANLQAGLEQFGKELQNLAGNAFVAIKTIFNGVFNVILVLVLTFFMVVDEKGIDSFFISLFPSKHTKYIIAKTEAVKKRFGYWLRGQVILMLGMAVITYIGLLILGVDYALSLALLAGITELLPVIGPLIAAIPAVLIGLNETPMMAVWVILLYIIIQQIEGNILVPMIMKKAVGLSPIVIIIVMLVGFQFLGILGIIIAVPVATALSIFIKDYAAKKK